MINTFKARLRGSWRSLTIWFNGVVGSVATLLPVAQDSFPALQSYLPANVYAWIAGALVFGNMLLRFKTTLDLADKVR